MDIQFSVMSTQQLCLLSFSALAIVYAFFTWFYRFAIADWGVSTGNKPVAKLLQRVYVVQALVLAYCVMIAIFTWDLGLAMLSLAMLVGHVVAMIAGILIGNLYRAILKGGLKKAFKWFFSLK